METPLTPMDFARRARRLYPEQEAVVDGDLRLTYEQFFDRCDRWSSILQQLGVQPGDRVAYIAPNTHFQLAHFKAPHGVTFLPELPKTATGKVQKYVLRGGRAAISRQ